MQHVVLEAQPPAHLAGQPRFVPRKPDQFDQRDSSDAPGCRCGVAARGRAPVAQFPCLRRQPANRPRSPAVSVGGTGHPARSDHAWQWRARGPATSALPSLSNAVSERAVDAASTVAGSCTCQPGWGCSSGYSRSALGSSTPGAVDAKGGHLHCGRTDIDADDDVSRTVVHVTGTELRRLDEERRRRSRCRRRAQAPGRPRPPVRLRKLTRIGCLLGGRGSWVLDRGAQPAQMQDPGGEGGGAADGDPSGRSLGAERRQRAYRELG